MPFFSKKPALTNTSTTDANWQQLFDAMDKISVQGYDRHRRVVYWNAASEHLYGYSRSEALGRQLEDLIIPPAMREQVIAAVANWFDHKIPIPTGELTLTSKYGQAVHVLSSHLIPPALHDGEIIMYCVDIDLSERVKTEVQLKASEARLRHMVEQLPAGALYVEGQQVWLNRAAEMLIGYPRAQIQTLDDWFRTVYHDQADAMRALFESDRKQGFPCRRQMELTHQDGSKRLIEFAGFADEKSEVHLMIDVTEREQAQQALRMSEERYELAVQGSNDGLWDWDIVGQVMHYSERFATMLGYGPEGMGDEFATLIDHIHVDERDQVVAYMESHLRLHTPFEVECRMTRCNGKNGWFRLRGEAIWDEAGIPIRMAGSISDVSESKTTLEALLRSEARLADAQLVAKLGNWEWLANTNEMWWSEVMYHLHDVRPLQFHPSLEAFLQLMIEDDREPARTQLNRVTEDRHRASLEYRIRQTDGRYADIWLTCYPRINSDGRVTGLRGTAQDITERKHSERLLAGERKVLELIASGQALELTLDTLCAALSMQLPGGKPCVQELKPDTKELCYLASERLPEPFVRATDGLPATPYSGSCPAAAVLKRPINVENIGDDIIWSQNRDLALNAQLLACWAQPIESKQYRVIGVLGVYFHDNRLPTAAESETIERMARLAGIAIENHRIETALRQSEERWHFALEGSRDGVWDWHIAANEAYYSRQYEQILGASQLHPLSHALGDWAQRIHTEDKPRVHQAIEHCFTQDDGHYTCEYRVLSLADNQYRWVLARGKVTTWDESGQPIRMIGTLTDISDNKRAEEELRLNAKVFEGTGEGILITDRFNRIMSVNAAFSKITGYARDEVIGRNPSMLSSGRHGTDFFRAMWAELKAANYWQGEIYNRRKNGEVFPEWLTISVLRKDNGDISNFIATFSDISERKAQAEHIQFLANFDVLTQLPNRQLFKDRVHTAIATAHRMRSRLALLFIDLDRFKNINDSLGHHVGDTLLQLVAERLKQVVREADTVARMGGDEFVVMLTDLRNGEDAAPIAQKVINIITQPYALNDHDLRLTPSIGISVYPDDGEDFETLVKHADAAMYHAKDSGRNNYQFFTHNMNARVFEHLMMENSLRRALEREEFLVYYQPQVDVQTGAIIGAEALIRWRHPEFGLVSPAKFIPVAEESGLIVPISDWVLRTVCRQGQIWIAQGLPAIPISINVSALHFKQKDFIDKLIAALDQTERPPELVELELTESILMQDAEAAIANMGRLKGIGVRLSIDDFGTGYSSLSYLKRFPIDKLKIDQSFVRDLPHDADNAAITAAIISLAQSLHLQVIAEGVEDEEQRDFLLSRGCTENQGFLHSPPLPAEEFAKQFCLRPA
ncbi:diguanylate cyclase (GGDEF)-like protein/PAS domain S-box-containing protein [Chitinivorax tropicus]|uniref:Diguanylate cyclase (GGDEF)-like protein/PAS domain S-box-containing protein n=1 Tax=Chitinivorax tropicus TaxID=714531 RepID=A0A840MJF8_9PROT|nr:EAL domain-containing protein [Chitinivorax tropicus]MBB5018778.1 diguanylate cyclase (GGDEF)-like protein/PAS domain S-box-containing protein [Chitinivorax tropicus]